MNEWKTIRLGDVCEILNGYAFKSDKYVDSGIRVIRITNVQKGFIEDNSPAFYPITEKENLKDYELYENDLLISLTGNVGRVALLSKDMLPAALNQRVGCIRIKDKNILISYLFTYLNSNKFESDCIFSARGIAQKNMSTEWLKNYLIPLPPLEEQKKIAIELEKCSEIISKHQKQLRNFDTLIKSRFIEMFGDPVQNPMGWEVKKLCDWCTKVTDGTHDTPPRYSSGVLLLTGKNIRADHIDFSEVEYVSEEDHKIIYERCNPELGDVLYTNIGVNYGTAVLNTLDYPFSMKNIALLKPKHSLLSGYYLWFVLNLLRTKILDEHKTGGAQTFMSLATIRNLLIPVPPLELQQQFAAFVQQIDKSKFAVQKSLEKTETLYKSLMQEYFG